MGARSRRRRVGDDCGLAGLAGVVRGEGAVTGLREKRNPHFGLDVANAMRFAQGGFGDAREGQCALFRMDQAAGRADDDRAGICGDTLECVETRGKAGRRDEPFPFVVMAAPVIQTGRQGFGITRRAGPARRAGQGIACDAVRGGVFGRAPVGVLPRKASVAVERVWRAGARHGRAAIVADAWGADARRAEGEYRVGGKGDVAIWRSRWFVMCAAA